MAEFGFLLWYEIQRNATFSLTCPVALDTSRKLTAWTGYLFWEYPTSRLLQRFPLAKYSSLCIILWGFVQCCHAGIVNYPGAITARIFLGAFEAAITPGFALFTSQVRLRPVCSVQPKDLLILEGIY